MHTMNPAGLALLVRGAELPSRLQAWLPDVPVACAATPGELAALLRDPRWRAVAIEVAALGDRAEDMITRVSALFPDVPVIAIGSRAEARRLETLVSAGCVQRFLHQPLGQARTRACLQAVLAAPNCLARPAERAVPPGRRPLRLPRWNRMAARVRLGLLAALVLATVLVSALVLAGAMSAPARTADGTSTHLAGAGARSAAPQPRHAAEATDPALASLLVAAADARHRGALFEPAGDNAIEFYRRAIELAPADPRARIALQNLGDSLLAAGEAALAQRRLTEAYGRGAQAARVLTNDPRVADLQQRVSAARERAAASRQAWARAAAEWSRPAPPRGVGYASLPDGGDPPRRTVVPPP